MGAIELHHGRGKSQLQCIFLCFLRRFRSFFAFWEEGSGRMWDVGGQRLVSVRWRTRQPYVGNSGSTNDK